MLKKYILWCSLIVFMLFTIPIMSEEWYIYEHNLTSENLNFMNGYLGDFVVGNNGIVLHCSYPSYSNLTNPEWRKEYPPTFENLFGISSTPMGIYIVGNNGTICYKRGGTGKWTLIDSPTSDNLFSVTLIKPKEGFIVGSSGSILYGGGEEPVWYKYESSPTTKDLHSVSGDEYNYIPNTSWAVGAGGTIVDYENGVWSLYPNSPTTNDLYCVSVYFSTQAYACGANGTILLWNGSSWFKVESTTSENLYAIKWWTDYDVFCVGANGTILYSSDKGYTWKKESCPVNINLYGIACNGIYVWAVGKNGTILIRGKVLDNIIPESIGIIKSIFSSQTIQSNMNKIY
jgi:photosystem II stability/assembly factor-like uncharacterized protein